MDVPIIGVVSDKEKGLVPAVEQVFPDSPYQFCHTHFLKNCALPLKEDLSCLGGSVRRRAEEARKIGKSLSSSILPSGADCTESSSLPEATIESSVSDGTTTMTEEQLAREVCELVRVNSKVSGKAPLDPPELKRHQRLERIHKFVEEKKLYLRTLAPA
jgi:hypothetical protein